MEAIDCEPLANVVQRLGCRSRLKLRGTDLPESWAAWLIAPVTGHLEPAGCGPWPAWEVEWVEVDPVPRTFAAVVAEFSAAGLSAGVVAGYVRVSSAG